MVKILASYLYFLIRFCIFSISIKIKSFFVSFVRSSFSKFVIREIEKKVETGAKSASPAKRDRLAFYYFAQVQC